MMRDISSVETPVCHSHSVAVFIKAATTALGRCSIPMDNVRKSANVDQMER